MALAVAVPEFGPLFGEMKAAGAETIQGEVKVSRQRRLENLLVRVATRRRNDGSLEGYVAAFDDVFVGDDLALVYRFPSSLLAAWRRIDAAVLAYSKATIKTGT